MKPKKKIGVWMDHASAQLLDYGQDAKDIRIIESKNQPSTKTDGSKSHSTDSEVKAHHIKQNKLNNFYKALEQELGEYDEILLTGGKTAKEEFLNRIKDNSHFKSKIIYKMTADKFTPNQFAVFVNEKLNEKLAKGKSL
jgi:hypothetical protein